MVVFGMSKSAMITKRTSRIVILSQFLTVVALLAWVNPAYAQDSAAILKRLEAMEAEMAVLKAELKRANAKSATASAKVEPVAAKSALPPQATPAAAIDESMFRPQSDATTHHPAGVSDAEWQERVKQLGNFGITYRSDGFKVDGLRFGAYGESIFGGRDQGNGYQNGFDAERMVLLGTYALTEDIIFNTEIEFEHGGIAADADDKLGGAIEVEQLFVDLRANDYFTWRSPGVDVIPVGYINLFHEPTQYYSTNRPEIYDGLIPSTWFAPSTGAYGKIIDGLNYQFQVSAGLEDSAATANDDGEVPQDGYDAGISGTDALSYARAPIGDNAQVSDNLAYTGRLSYAPAFVPGLSGSSSFYYTNDTTPRGAYGTNPNGSTRPLGGSDLSLFDTEVRYRIPTTGFEIRSEFVQVNFGDTNNLRANNDGDATNNVGSDMYGYSFEGAYHVKLSSSDKTPWEFVPFYRYSQIDMQTSGFSGTDVNDPTGAGFNTYHTFGAALFPTPKLVLKTDYQFIVDKDSSTSDQKSLLGSVGFFF